VSANFSPSSVNTSGTVSVSFFVQSGTAPGTSNVTITGANGAISHSVTIALTIPGTANPSFTLAPSAATLAVTRGSSATDTVTVTGAGGFTGSVTLAVSGLPAGVTGTFGTNPTTGASVLTLAASSTATTGTSSLTITGTSGSLTATTSIALTVRPATAAGFACHIDYTISTEWPGGFGAAITINNTGTTAIPNWTLTWAFPNGQTITQLWNGTETQNGANVAVTSLSYNGSIASGGSYSGMGFNGAWNSVTNAAPTSFAVNEVACQ
jgi:uncharacterized membrane protein